METYIFSYAYGLRQEYMLPDDLTIRELIKQLIEDSYFSEHDLLGFFEFKSCEFIFESDEGESVAISQDNLDETIEMIGLKPNIEYLVDISPTKWVGCGEYRVLLGGGSVFGFYGDGTLGSAISSLKNEFGLLGGLGENTKNLSFITKYEAPVIIENNQANMEKMISEFGLKKNCEYLVSCNSESYKLKKLTIDIGLIKGPTYILPDCVLIEEMLRLIAYDASIKLQDNNLYVFVSEKGERIYIDEQTDATKTIAEMGFKSCEVYCLKAYSDNAVGYNSKTYTFSFINGTKEKYALPDDVTIRELVAQFVEDGLLCRRDNRKFWYSFIPEVGRTIVVENINLDQSIRSLGFRPEAEYYTVEYALHQEK